jgi:amidase
VDVIFKSAAEVAGMLRRKEVSSRELAELLFARIDAINPALNAVVEQRREAALREAAAADEATARGAMTGTLHGVPLTIKESFDVAGLSTTWGNPAFRDFVATTDATVVRRLRDAGAIVTGKTNVAFRLGDFMHTVNDLYGVTRNPWSAEHSPGGSSGGAAAAVAAGLTFLEHGTDLVGSVRVPASFCGVYGLRPSVGTVPLTGMQPPGVVTGPSDMMYLSTVGPLARSAADLRIALEAVAGPEVPQANAYSWTLAAPRHTRLADFRVGVVLDHPAAPVTSDVGASLSAAVDAVAAAGATIVEGWPSGVDPVRDAESFGFHVGVFFAYAQPGDDLPAFADVVAHERRRMAARAAWTRYFTDVDVFLCPATFRPALAHDERDERLAFWTAHPALAGLPAVVAPVGRTPAGLPVGVQLVGPLHEDDTAITFAELLADVAGSYEPPVWNPQPATG